MIVGYVSDLGYSGLEMGLSSRGHVSFVKDLVLVPSTEKENARKL